MLFKSLILLNLIIIVNLKEEKSKELIERLTYEQTYDKDNTFYLINTEDEYKEINKLTKDENFKYSGHILINGKDKI